MKLATKVLSTVLLFSGLLFLNASTASAAIGACPFVGTHTGCDFVISISDTGTVTVSPGTPTGSFGDGDDLIYGVTVDSNFTGSVLSLLLSGTNIFGFDGDGACTVLATAGCSGGNNGADTSGYAGFVSPDGNARTDVTASVAADAVTFSPVDPNSGVVIFGAGIAAGGSAWFSLEGSASLLAESSLNDNGDLEAVPEPGTLVLFGTGALALMIRRRNRRVS